MTNTPEEKRFSIVKRAQSFTHAFRGLRIFINSTHNSWIHLCLIVITIFLGFYFNITEGEWLAVVFAGGFVLVSEAFNTAIEIDINLTSPDFHPYAKDTKDVAAAAVLISAGAAFIIGLIIFLPHIFALTQ